MRDHLVASLENLLPYIEPISPLYNFFMRLPLSRWALEKYLGFVDSPLISRLSFDKAMLRLNVGYAKVSVLQSMSCEEKSKTVVVVPDAFTRYFDTAVVTDYVALLIELGFTPLIAPYSPNGKPLHVHGFLTRFKRTAIKNSRQLNSFAQQGVDLVGVDPAMTLTYRSEYHKILGNDQRAPEVLLPQEFLVKHLDQIKHKASKIAKKSFKLLPHCTEKTNAAGSLKDWSAIFDALNLELEILPSGCCGMSGTFGHEARNKATSQKRYDLSWNCLF